MLFMLDLVRIEPPAPIPNQFAVAADEDADDQRVSDGGHE
jgi:hypothetical protein